MGLWSDDDEISCVHPGGQRLVGAAAIRASFEAMFANGAIDAEPHQVRRLESHSTRGAQRRSSGCASFGPTARRFAWVVATNVYVKADARLAAGGASRQPRHRERGAGDRRDGSYPAPEPAGSPGCYAYSMYGRSRVLAAPGQDARKSCIECAWQRWSPRAQCRIDAVSAMSGTSLTVPGLA